MSARRPRPLPGPASFSLRHAWHHEHARGWIWQILVVLAVLGVGAWLVGNAQHALARQGIATGLAFLNNAAGFEIGDKPIAFSSTDSFLRAYGVAILNTLQVSAAGVVLATVVGVLVGVGRLSPNWLVRKLAAIYVEVFRNTPQLLQLVFWYLLITRLPRPRDAFALGDAFFLSNRGLSMPWTAGNATPWLLLLAVMASALLAWFGRQWVARRQLNGATHAPLATLLPPGLAAIPLVLALLFAGPFDLTSPVLRGFNFQGGKTVAPEFLALLLGMALYIAAFIAEIVRSGIQSVARGQIEAARSVGLGSFDTYRKIIFPQALRVMIPPAAGQYVSMLKNSSLGVAVGYPELFSVNNTIVTLSGHAVEAIALMMLVYLLISFAIAALMNLYNRAVQIKER
jgi:general L-amino acid transport system permease protein